MSMPTDNNILVKEYNEMTKYKNLEEEIEKMWYFETTTVPAIVGVLAMIKKGTDTHINKIPDSRYWIQKKIAFYWTAHLFRKILSMWLKNINQRPSKNKYLEYL